MVFESRSLRLLTATLVVTWWPGHWGCCQLYAADAGTAAQPEIASLSEAAESADCHASACCAEKTGPEAGSLHTAPSGAGCGVGCGTGGPDRGRPCLCIHAPIDAALPSATAAPSPGKHLQAAVDLLMELSPAVAAVAAIGRLTNPCRGSPPIAAAQSLVALRCMLTT